MRDYMKDAWNWGLMGALIGCVLFWVFVVAAALLYLGLWAL